MASPYPNMAVPGASDLMSSQGMADQVAGETEEQRKKRLAAMQASQQTPVGMSSLAGGYGDALSMA